MNGPTYQLLLRSPFSENNFTEAVAEMREEVSGVVRALLYLVNPEPFTLRSPSSPFSLAFSPFGPLSPFSPFVRRPPGSPAGKEEASVTTGNHPPTGTGMAGRSAAAAGGAGVQEPAPGRPPP